MQIKALALGHNTRHALSRMGGQTSDLLALDILPHHPDKIPTVPVLRRRLYLVLITLSLRQMGGKIKGPTFWVRVVAEQHGGPSLFSCSVVSDSVTPWTAAHQTSLSFTISQSLLKLMSIESVSDAIQPSHPLSSPSPPALNLSQHQGLF